jgi:hypothetical protein
MRPLNRDIRRLATASLSLISFLLCTPRSIALTNDLPSLSFWVQSYEARVWAGYKDNVLLSHRETVSSPLVAGGLDLMFFRLPVNGWEYLFLTSADYTRYISGREAEQEAVAFAQAQAKKAFWEVWRSGLSAEYFYFNQVFDTSVFQERLGALHVQGHSFVLRPSLGRELGSGYRLDLELPATRQIFQEFIDGYWEVGPKLTLAREYGRKSSLSGIYQFSQRLHDTRQARDADGQIQPGRQLEFNLHELGAIWRHFWGQDRSWRAVTRLSLQRNFDNGGGYYDYLRPLISEQIRYQGQRWGASLEGRLSHFAYEQQRIADPDASKRARTLLRLILRGEKSLPKSWKTFAQYELERALSNLDIDRYTAHTISAGLSREF